MSGQTPRPPAGKQVWTNGSGEMRSPSSGQYRYIWGTEDALLAIVLALIVVLAGLGVWIWLAS